jgi:hypothetical protein
MVCDAFNTCDVKDMARALPKQKPASFLSLLIILSCKYFADVASNLMRREDKKNLETVSKSKNGVSMCNKVVEHI